MLSMPRIVRPDPAAFTQWKLGPPLARSGRAIKRNKELSVTFGFPP
jgi:hypothetical protein